MSKLWQPVQRPPSPESISGLSDLGTKIYEALLEDLTHKQLKLYETGEFKSFEFNDGLETFRNSDWNFNKVRSSFEETRYYAGETRNEREKENGSNEMSLDDEHANDDLSEDGSLSQSLNYFVESKEITNDHYFEGLDTDNQIKPSRFEKENSFGFTLENSEKDWSLCRNFATSNRNKSPDLFHNSNIEYLNAYFDVVKSITQDSDLIDDVHMYNISKPIINCEGEKKMESNVFNIQKALGENSQESKANNSSVSKEKREQWREKNKKCIYDGLDKIKQFVIVNKKNKKFKQLRIDEFFKKNKYTNEK